MEYQEKQLLQASSYRTLPKQIKDELPDWCTDESSFQQYKRKLNRNWIMFFMKKISLIGFY
jgi:hypothetical protein